MVVVEIFMGVAIIGFIIFAIILITFDGKIPFLKKKKGKINESSSDKKDKKERQSEEDLADTREIIDFEHIETIHAETPVGLLYRNGEYLAYINITGVNYNLLSIDERIRLELNFQELLNGLEYPIQLYIQSRKLDIGNYSSLYTQRLENIKNELDVLTKKYEIAKRDNSDSFEELEEKYKKLYRQYEYAEKIFTYTMNKCNSNDMLIKKYYIVIKHKLSDDTLELDERERLLTAYYDLDNKAAILIGSLKRNGLNGKLLSPLEVADLMYSSYNKTEADLLKLKGAVESRFNSMFISSKPVEAKKIEVDIEKIEELEKENSKKIRETLKKANEQNEDYYNLDIDIDNLKLESEVE